MHTHKFRFQCMAMESKKKNNKPREIGGLEGVEKNKWQANVPSKVVDR